MDYIGPTKTSQEEKQLLRGFLLGVYYAGYKLSLFWYIYIIYIRVKCIDLFKK